MKRVKRWLMRKDGRRQRYNVNFKKLKKTRYYDRNKRAWVLRIEARKKAYRSLMCKCYYSTLSKGTPTPFLDFKISFISMEKQGKEIMNELKIRLKRLEWIFKSVFIAMRDNKIISEIDAEEHNREIDFNEIDKLEQINNYWREAIFFKADKRIVYNEYDIRRIEKIRESEYKEYRKKRGVI